VHVGLNLIYLVPGETGGTEIVARELLPELVAAAPDVRFTAFLNHEAAEAVGGPWKELMDWTTVPVKARRRSEWVRGEQVLLPRLAEKARVDLVHSLANTAPLRGRFVRVVTIHDLIHRFHPETHGRAKALVFGTLVRLAASRSHRIMADSQSTARDLERELKVPEHKVDVVPLAVDPAPAVEPEAEAVLRARHGLGDRQVVLTLSAKRPHKNLIRLLDALALIPADERPILLLPGYPTPFEATLERHAADNGVAGDVRLLGWISTEEREGLYRLASCFAFPSLYEGFGLPVLEAMSRGVPVACSDRGSLGEVAGGAAELFDPESPRSMADAIRRLLRDPIRADELRAAGRAQAARYSWAATAEATLHSYRTALSPG
jgi:glycosyltransferase involved in cell wall biosynthesis